MAARLILHRIREAWSSEPEAVFSRLVEVDETYIGGKRKDMLQVKRKELNERGAVGKTILAGAKNRATNRVSASVAPRTDKATLQDFVSDRTVEGATVYTDKHGEDRGMPFDHETINHGVGEYVRQQAQINSKGSFWSFLNRGCLPTLAWHNVCESDTIDQMTGVVSTMVGKRIMYGDLFADKELSSGVPG